jgi:hypothetical protein
VELVNQIIAWLGALGLLTAFFLNATGRMESSSNIYHYINMVSAFLLAINAFHLHAYPFLVVNVFWTGVSIYSLIYKK